MKGKNNEDIRIRIRKGGLKYWEVAQVMNIQDSAFSRLLRYPLTENKRAEILEAIDKAAAEQ